MFEAIVENGEQDTKNGKLIFELRGEGTLPSLQIDRIEEHENDGTPILRFKKTRIGKDCTQEIALKNDGQVPATARFDAIPNDAFQF
jgi:hydrocephalus-inducing protein